MTDTSPNPVYREALAAARSDYADLKQRQEALMLEIEATEKRIGIYRAVISALAAILGEPHGLPATESTTRRFRMKR